MGYKGIIFDFNGTLFWDSEKHELAWKRFSKDLRGHELSDEEIRLNVHGRTNKVILEYILEKTFNDNSFETLSEEKEKVYRDMCLDDKDSFKLAPGATELFDYLKERHIPFTIATASGKENVSFFIEKFNLDKWFDTDKIIFDDGTILGKPEPDMYIKASKTLNLDPKDCIVFEDAVSGVEAARRANIGKILVITPTDKEYLFKNMPSVSGTIIDFNFNKEFLELD